jgi:hypothetical protein
MENKTINEVKQAILNRLHAEGSAEECVRLAQAVLLLTQAANCEKDTVSSKLKGYV